MNADNMHKAICEAIRTFKRQGGGGCLKDQINELETNSKNRNIRDLYSGRNLLYLFIRTVIKWTVAIVEEYHCHRLCRPTKFYPAFLCQG
jgi:hypothetical protein